MTFFETMLYQYPIDTILVLFTVWSLVTSYCFKTFYSALAQYDCSKCKMFDCPAKECMGRKKKIDSI